MIITDHIARPISVIGSFSWLPYCGHNVVLTRVSLPNLYTASIKRSIMPSVYNVMLLTLSYFTTFVKTQSSKVDCRAEIRTPKQTSSFIRAWTFFISLKAWYLFVIMWTAFLVTLLPVFIWTIKHTQLIELELYLYQWTSK